MTQSSPSPSVSTRLPVPQDRVAYSNLSTDFYPWTELLSELDRTDQEFTAVLDMQQENRWARFVWVRGELRGGVGGAGRDVTLETAMRALPRAYISLAHVEPLIAEIIWKCRATPPRPLATVWPDAYDQLSRERFFGALISGSNCSFWESGRVITGSLPQTDVPCLIVSPLSNLDRESLVLFWEELISITYNYNPEFDATWRQVTVELSKRYPVLDPFLRDIAVHRGRLLIEADVPTVDMRPALLAAFQTTLSRLGIRLTELPIDTLSNHPGWLAAGLEVL